MPTGKLTPPDTWSRRIWDLHMFYLLRLILVLIFSDYALRTSFGTFLSLLTSNVAIEWCDRPVTILLTSNVVVGSAKVTCIAGIVARRADSVVTFIYVSVWNVSWAFRTKWYYREKIHTMLISEIHFVILKKKYLNLFLIHVYNLFFCNFSFLMSFIAM